MSYDSLRVEMRIGPDGAVEVSETHEVTLSGSPEIFVRPFPRIDAGAITFTRFTENGRYYLAGNLERKETYRIDLESGRFNPLSRHKIFKWRSHESGETAYDKERKNFTIEYRLSGVLGNDGNLGRLRWYPLFEPGGARLQQVEIKIFFPRQMSFRQTRFVVRGDRISTGLGRFGKTVLFSACNLKMADQAMVELSFPAGQAGDRFSRQMFYRYRLKPYATGGMALLLLAAVLLLGRRYFRPLAGNTVPVGREEWRSLPPVPLGLLPDGQFNNREIGAAAIELARRGIIAIRDRSTDDAAFSGYYEISLLTDWRSLSLPRYEQVILKKFFPAGIGTPRTVIPELSIFFHSCRRQLVRAVWEAAAGQGWFVVSPDVLRRWAVVAGLLLLVTGLSMAAAELPFLTLGLACSLGFGVAMLFSLFKAYRNEGDFTIFDGILAAAGMVAAVMLIRYGSHHSEWLFDCGVMAIMAGMVLPAVSPWLVFRTRKGDALLAALRREAELAADGPEGVFADADLLPYAVACGLPLNRDGADFPFMVKVPYLQRIGRTLFDLQRFCVGLYAPWTYYCYFMNFRNYRNLPLGLVAARRLAPVEDDFIEESS